MFLQPDMGTASVYIPIFLLMCFFAGIPYKYLLYILSFGMLTILFTILPVWNTEIVKNPHKVISILTNKKLMAILIGSTSLIAVLGAILRKYFHAPKYTSWIAYIFSIITLSLFSSVLLGKVLKVYQIKRLIVFLDPNTDPLGSGWNIIQSKIAIGAGGIFGQGYLNGTSIRIGGDKFDEAIVKHVRSVHNLIIGQPAAERLKIQIGNAAPEKTIEKMELKGTDAITGLPRRLEIDSVEVREALKDPVNRIVEEIKTVLSETPPELASDIIERGIVMTGGGSMLRELPRLISKETGDLQK